MNSIAYNKYGKSIDITEWATLMENPTYKRIDLTKLWWTTTVSTVWIGLDHSFGLGAPLFFETMVFGPNGKYLDVERYSGLADARNGHLALVKKWSKPIAMLKYIIGRRHE